MSCRPAWWGWAAVVLAAATLVPAMGSAAGPAGTAHDVKRRETLSGIARRYGVSVRDIVSANRLSGPRSRVQAGSRLTIPDARRGRRGDEIAQPPAAASLRARRAALRATSRGDVVAPPPPNLVLAIPDAVGSAPEFAWPVEGAVSSPFGRRWRSWHRGVDVVALEGAPVRAAAAGVVIASGSEPRYGRVVKIEHDSGFVTVYAHNLANGVEVGQRVSAGQEIATVGQTGLATNPHLHFEIRHEGRAVNPLYLLPLPPRVVVTGELGIELEDDDE